MPLLAFDTSTDTMSIAVGDGRDTQRRVWQHSAAGGAQASATLIPAILDLMSCAGIGFGDLDAIAFGCGPGAFTGLRTACSVAQGLAFGARMPPGRAPLRLLAVDTLLAVAEEARSQQTAPGQPLRVLAMLDARMDEIYAGAYAFDGRRWAQLADYRLARPEDLDLPAQWHGQDVLLAGNVFAAYGDRLPFANAAHRLAVLPTATAMLRLAPDLLAQGCAVAPEHALPTYIRDKVAQTTSERAAAKAVPAVATAPA
jgi:tRNA threonylcarbamoyladenosine biosynthesis protein TsaB